MSGELTPPVSGDVTPRAGRFAAGASLRSMTARGTVINGAFLTMVNGLTMTRGFIMAGFLSAEEYGVWGILLVMVATLLLLKQMGIGGKFVQQDDVDQEAAFQKAFTLELLLAVVLTLLGFGLIAGAAAAYDTPQVVLPGFVLLATLPAAALQFPLFVFYRRMDFRRQRLLQSVDPLLAFAVTIGLAIAGLDYWALVAGSVAGAIAGAAVALTASPYRLRLRFDRQALTDYGSFSWPIALAGLSAVAMAQSLTAVGEITLGLAGVGAIALSAQISQFADRADRAITETMYPAICAVKDRVDLMFEAFLKSNRLALAWAVPFGLGIALFAEDLLVRVFGPQWAPAVELIQATAVALAIHQIGVNWQAFYRAQGRTRPIAVAAGISVATLVVLVLPLLAWQGLEGLAVGVLLAEAVALPMRVHYLRRLFPDFRPLRHAARAIGPVLPAVLLVLAVRQVAPADRDLAFAALEAALYVLAVVAATWRAERALIGEVIGHVTRRRAAAVGAA